MPSLPTPDKRLSLILRPASTGDKVFEEGGGGRITWCFVAHRLFFFSRPIVHFSFASVGILRETVKGPGPTRVDVTVINKDYVGWYLQCVEIFKVAENSWG